MVLRWKKMLRRSRTGTAKRPAIEEIEESIQDGTELGQGPARHALDGSSGTNTHK
jgi:hypothetical protein